MSTNQYVHKVVIIAPTCFYYQVPLFRELAAHPNLDLTVYFCSEESLKAEDVAEMYHTKNTWGVDQELLQGYKHKFLRNYSPFPSYLKSFFGLINLGVCNELRKDKPDLVILMSWMNPTWWMAILTSEILRIPFFYMTDANAALEALRSKWKRRIKGLILGKVLFRLSAGFLCAGTANQNLYEAYGVPTGKLFPFAYSWGYQSIIEGSEALVSQRSELRASLGVPEDAYAVLYCGRLSKEKGLFDLLDAYARTDNQKKFLLIVGDGEVRNDLEAYTDQKGIESVRFYGFQGRHEIFKYYAIADALVLPSYRETWGMVVNEAMCFGLPIVVSNQVGAGVDLVSDRYNGLHFTPGDIPGLSRCLQNLMDLPQEEQKSMRSRSLKLIEDWSTRDLASALVGIIHDLHQSSPKRVSED